jgi:hypothetical protein
MLLSILLFNNGVSLFGQFPEFASFIEFSINSSSYWMSDSLKLFMSVWNCNLLDLYVRFTCLTFCSNSMRNCSRVGLIGESISSSLASNRSILFSF